MIRTALISSLALGCAVALPAQASATSYQLTVTTNPLPATVAYGESFVFEAQVSGADAPLPGYVKFWDIIDPIAEVPVDETGFASAGVVTPSTIGQHSYLAVYTENGPVPAGDPWPNMAISATQTVNVTKAPVMVAVARATNTLASLTPSGRFSATVTSRITGAPVAGTSVTFTVTSPLGDQPACTATTDASGAASCTSTQLTTVLLSGNKVRATTTETGFYLAGSGLSA